MRVGRMLFLAAFGFVAGCGDDAGQKPAGAALGASVPAIFGPSASTESHASGSCPVVLCVDGYEPIVDGHGCHHGCRPVPPRRP
jgi:hypothetical protein